MAFDFVGFLKGFAVQLGAQGIVTLLIFVVTVYFLYKGVKLGIHLLIAAVAGGLFPFLAGFIGLKIPVTINNIVLFSTAAALLVIVGTVLKHVLRIFK
ncbi:MAG: hypothetical protein HY366_00550 [Candidatus Aenigmarchaeota archaeon]|nr:hypothetical protein [Candidatus Aenigmarchaeota archaeon]